MRCVSAGYNTATELDETESLFLVDFISRYALTASADVFLKVDNLFDEQQIVSRLPERHGEPAAHRFTGDQR